MAHKERLTSTTPGVYFDIEQDLGLHNQHGYAAQARRNFRVCLAREYHVDDKTPKSQVAIKMPCMQQRPDRQDMLQRVFDKEQRCLRNLTRHDNIVRWLGGGHGTLNKRDTVSYMVLRYIDGQTLGEIMAARQTPFEPYQAVGIVCQLAEALDHIHRNDIVHCDLKPDNLMIDFEAQQVVLIDFGAAWMKNERSRYEPRGIRGEYAAPEQLDDTAILDETTDIYAFGAIVYELFTNRILFAGRTDDNIRAGRWITPTAEELQQQLATFATGLAQLAPGIEAKMAGVLHACFQEKPGDRPASAGTLMRNILDLFVQESLV
jgi:serine/threonine-protein kinase